MPTAPYSPFRTVDGFTYFSGLVGWRDGVPGKDLEQQLALIFEQLDAALHRAGLERRHIVKCTVWLADMADWERMNVPYLEYFADCELPTRSATGAQLLPGLLVELEALAHRNA
jgi:enamine deaminase RidA (YjgF/YER057c/UK114 family)